MTSFESPLQHIVNPRSVAVIGASESTEKFGGRVMNFIVKHGFKGKVLPVNPSASAIRGIAVYKEIGHAPGPIDVALIAVPSAQIESSLDSCGRAGVAGCVVLTADFAEVGDDG